MENPNDRQVAGKHYEAGYQHWDLVYDLSGSVAYFQGCATKYAARWRKKYPDDLEKQIEDLEKVAHYVEKMIWLFRNVSPKFENALLHNDHRQEIFTIFVHENELSQTDLILCDLILFWENVADLEAARALALAVAERVRGRARAAAMPVQAPAPDPSTERFTPLGAVAPACVAGSLARHNAPTARFQGEIGTVIREVGNRLELRYDSVSNLSKSCSEFITVDKHYVEILEQGQDLAASRAEGMEHPFGYDAQQES